MKRVVMLVVVLFTCWAVYKRAQAPAAAINAPYNGPTNVHSAPAPTPSIAPSAASHTTSLPTAGSNARVGTTNSGKGFRDKAHFDEHFAKHGAEFPGLSKAQYLAAAQTLRDEPAGGNVLEIVRASDGVVSRFDKRSGAFLAFDRDGTIRTFFKPNDGEKYFRRQANRSPSQ